MTKSPVETESLSALLAEVAELRGHHAQIRNNPIRNTDDPTISEICAHALGGKREEKWPSLFIRTRDDQKINYVISHNGELLLCRGQGYVQINDFTVDRGDASDQEINEAHDAVSAAKSVCVNHFVADE